MQYCSLMGVQSDTLKSQLVLFVQYWSNTLSSKILLKKTTTRTPKGGGGGGGGGVCGKVE